MDPEGLTWFTEPFRFGVPPHGGFSLGIERFTASLLGIENVKEAALFPEGPGAPPALGRGPLRSVYGRGGIAPPPWSSPPAYTRSTA